MNNGLTSSNTGSAHLPVPSYPRPVISSDCGWADDKAGQVARSTEDFRLWPTANSAIDDEAGGVGEEAAMVQAVLVTYASKHGSTKEVAEAIGATLRSLGSRVDVAAAGGVKDLAGYDAVVVGSAVYHDRWQEEARNLLKRVRPQLCERPTWLFSSGPTGGTPDADAKVAAAATEDSSVPPRVSSMRLGGSVPADTSPFPAR
jgi:hypothetical protein